MYAILDIETTGGKYNEEGITEIAIFQFDGTKITDQFSSLVNPEREIQPFVVNLTGITQKMVQSAPKFHEIAKRVVEITEDCIVVAHNAVFDYRILQTEFRRLGYGYERKSICTVALAQKLVPNQPAYSLGKLVKNLGIPISNPHRAFGDANATLKLFELLLEKDTQKSILKTHISTLTPNKSPSKYHEMIDALPTEMGVYYLYNDKDDVIYIGKSNNIKKRVLSHVTNKQKKAKLIQCELSRVSYALTGGELVTLLKEQNEIKSIAPKYNTAQRYRQFPMGIRIDTSKDYPVLVCDQVSKEEEYISVFKNRKTAHNALHQWAETFRICLYHTNVEDQNAPCFLYGLKKCDGACIGEESRTNYSNKIESLVHYLSYPHPSFLLIERGREKGEYSFVWIHNSTLKGYGYFELNHQIKTAEKIESRMTPIQDNPDAQKLIRSFIARKKYMKLIPLTEEINKTQS